MLKNRLNLYTRKTLKGGDDMKKPTQTQTQTQTQIQAQAQQAKPLEGGAAMKKEQVQQQTQQNQDAMFYFVTFAHKVSPEKAREVLAELRKRFPQTPIFTPRIPRGRRIVLNINDLQVIVTFPHTLKNPNPNNNPNEGFSLKDLIKKS